VAVPGKRAAAIDADSWFLSFRSADESAGSVTAFRQGLSDSGFNEGRNVHIAFRWADGDKDRLPALTGELIDKLRVAVIVAAGGGPSAFAAKQRRKPSPSSKRQKRSA